jgi:uncharacterized protein (DUF1778 family)
MPTQPQVKIFLKNHEHATIRVAAAIRGISMSRFAKQVVLARAERIAAKAATNGKSRPDAKRDKV